MKKRALLLRWRKRKPKKRLQEEHQGSEQTDANDAASTNEADEKKARIAAAVAKAKAKKLAQDSNGNLATSSNTAEQESSKAHEQSESSAV